MKCPNCEKDYRFNSDKPIVVLGVPALDSTLHFSILQQWDHILKNYRGVAIVIECTYVDMARNQIVMEGVRRAEALYGAPPDYFLFVDSDSVIGKRDPDGTGRIFPRPEYLDQLMARNLDVVSGYYVKKSDPYAQRPVFGRGHTMAMYIDPYPKDDLQEADWFGGGYLLVKGDVFKKVEGPWFENRNDGFGVKGAKIVGEDIFFCKNLQNKGYKLYVDLKVKIGHHGGVAWPPEEMSFEELKEGQRIIKEGENHGIRDSGN